MKNKNVFGAIIAIALIAFACDDSQDITSPSGNTTTERYDIGDITTINLQDDLNLYLIYSDSDYVEIQADENIQQYIDITKVDNNITFSVENNVSLSDDESVKIYVYSKSISKVLGSGDADFHARDTMRATQFDLTLSGGSEFEGILVCDDLTVEISGDSDVDIAGYSTTLSLLSTGGSEFGDYSFIVEDLGAELSGASELNITVNGSITLDASGGSEVKYKGNAEVLSANLSGGSTLEQK